MAHQRERILTTHTGSIPRPEGLRTLLLERESATDMDQVFYESSIREAVSDCVRKQLASGIDIVNDGEMSKIGYANYVKDRLCGFDGPTEVAIPADLEEFPSYAQRLVTKDAMRSLALPSCVGPVRYQDDRPLRRDIENLRQALKNGETHEAFMSAASPGVISLFLANRYYRSHAAYVEALAHAMRHEYRAIHQAGFILQLDCPDLAMGRHMQYAGATLDEFVRRCMLHVEALNYATEDIPPERMRIHLCWGNYEGPHHRDVPLAAIVDTILRARPAGVSFPAANPRHEHEWAVWREIRLPEDKILIPGVVDSTHNFIEHSELVAERILRFARIVGPDRVIAGTDCGFSSFAGVSVVDPAIVWAKLAALADGAQLASAALDYLPRAQPVLPS